MELDTVVLAGLATTAATSFLKWITSFKKFPKWLPDLRLYPRITAGVVATGATVWLFADKGLLTARHWTEFVGIGGAILTVAVVVYNNLVSRD